MVQPKEPDGIIGRPGWSGHVISIRRATARAGCAQGAVARQRRRRAVGRRAQQRLLRDDWGVVADAVGDVMGEAASRACRSTGPASLRQGSAVDDPFVTRMLKDRPGPVVAVSDYMRAVQVEIAQWVPGDYSLARRRRLRLLDAAGRPLLPSTVHRSSCGLLLPGPWRRAVRSMRRSRAGGREIPPRRHRRRVRQRGGVPEGSARSGQRRAEPGPGDR